MKLAMIVCNDVALVVSPENAGPIITAFQGATVYNKPWYGDGNWTPKENAILSFEFIDDSKLAEKPEPIEKLTKDVSEYSDRWMKEITAHGKTKEALKVAEDKLKQYEAISTPKAD